MNDRTDNDDAATNTISAMRRRAEAVVRQKLRLSPETTAAVSHEAMQHTLHQLQVHQIELEMQNEELRLTQLELDGHAISISMILRQSVIALSANKG